MNTEEKVNEILSLTEQKMVNVGGKMVKFQSMDAFNLYDKTRKKIWSAFESAVRQAGYKITPEASDQFEVNLYKTLDVLIKGQK